MYRRRALSLLGGSAAALAAPAIARGQETDQIRVVGATTEGATNMAYAIRTGAFARAGLNVAYVPMASGAAATTAVVAGTYEIAYTSLIAVILAHLRGIPIVVIAPANLHTANSPLALLQIANDAPYKTGADLNGKTAAVPALNDLNTISIRAWVDKNGGDWHSLHFVELTNSAIVPAIVEHRVDAGVVQSPQLFESLAAGTTRTLGDSWSAIAPRFTAGLYVARADWAAAHRAQLRRFLAVYDEATNYTNAHPAETASYAADFTKVKLAVVQKMRRTTYATALDPAIFQPLIDAAAKYGATTRSFPARELFFS